MQSISQKTLTRLVLKTVPSCKSWAPLTSPWQTSFCQNNHLLIKKNNIVFPASKEAKNHHKTADFNPTSAPHRSWTSGASQHRKRIFLLRNPERWTNHHLSRPTKVTHREKWLGGRWVEKSKWEITIVFIYIYIYTYTLYCETIGLCWDGVLQPNNGNKNWNVDVNISTLHIYI